MTDIESVSSTPNNFAYKDDTAQPEVVFNCGAAMPSNIWMKFENTENSDICVCQYWEASGFDLLDGKTNGPWKVKYHQSPGAHLKPCYISNNPTITVTNKRWWDINVQNSCDDMLHGFNVCIYCTESLGWYGVVTLNINATDISYQVTALRHIFLGSGRFGDLRIDRLSGPATEVTHFDYNDPERPEPICVIDNVTFTVSTSLLAFPDEPEEPQDP